MKTWGRGGGLRGFRRVNPTPDKSSTDPESYLHICHILSSHVHDRGAKNFFVQNSKLFFYCFFSIVLKLI